MPSPDLVLAGSYDHGLLALSVVIAVLSSYTALDLAGRVTAHSRPSASNLADRRGHGDGHRHLVDALRRDAGLQLACPRADLHEIDKYELPKPFPEKIRVTIEPAE